MEDGGCGGSGEEALIDAEKPEGWEVADGRALPEVRSGLQASLRDGREEQQDGEQEHDGRALKQRGDAAKDVFADGVEEDALQGEECGGGEHSAREDCGEVGEIVAEEVGLLGDDGKKMMPRMLVPRSTRPRKIARASTRAKKRWRLGDGEDGEDEDVEEIGEEEVPLVDGCGSHDDEGVHDVEVVVAGLGPEGADARVRAGSAW